MVPPTVNDIPAGSSEFTVTFTPSRTAGVCPLYVFFDASATLLASDSDTDLEATYIWSFDTTAVDSSTNYNRVSGFVAGHVFNGPGTYTVRLDVFDRSGNHGFSTQTITVSDFSGTTYYAAANGLDSNPGTIGSPVLTAPHALSLAAPNTRILFRNGDVFNLSSMLSFSGNGPVIVSGYSDPAAPSSVRPELHATYTDSDWYALSQGTNTDDWRFVGLKITTTGHSGLTSPRYPGGMSIAGTNNLVSRVEFEELGTMGVGIIGDSNALYECEFHLLSRCVIYTDNGNIPGEIVNTRHSVIGNYLHDMQSDYEEHALRTQGISKFFVGFNVFEADGTKDGVQIRGFSDHVVLYSNVLDRATAFHPQNSGGSPYEEIHHCIADANVFIGRTDPAYNNPFPTRECAVAFGGHDFIARNNIVYNYEAAFRLEDDTPNIPLDARVHIENNTVISPVTVFSFLNYQGATATRLRNNLFYSTALTEPNQYDLFWSNYTSNPLDGTSDYNLFFGANWSSVFHLFGVFPDVSLAQWQANTSQDLHSQYSDPGIAVTDPVVAGFARPASDSPVVGAGTAIGNRADAAGRIRGIVPSIGALESITVGAAQTRWRMKMLS
jgi:hypothetical protein